MSGEHPKQGEPEVNTIGCIDIDPQELLTIVDDVKGKVHDAFGEKARVLSVSVQRTEYEGREFNVHEIRLLAVQVRPMLKVVKR